MINYTQLYQNYLGRLIIGDQLYTIISNCLDRLIIGDKLYTIILARLIIGDRSLLIVIVIGNLKFSSATCTHGHGAIRKTEFPFASF